MSEPFSKYDRRHYPTFDVSSGYDQWAPTYDESVDSRLDFSLLQSLKHIPPLTSATAADLGCGTGRVGSWLQANGIAAIDGVDLSKAMIERAGTKGFYRQLLNCDFIGSELPSATYDLVITSLTACHLPNLEQLYGEAKRLLRSPGLFLLLDYHPFFLLRGIPTHFKKSQDEPVAIANHVHFMSDHVTAGRRFGMTLEEMRERFVDEEWVAAKPAMARYVNQPVSFVMVWSPAPSAGDRDRPEARRRSRSDPSESWPASASQWH